MTRRAASAFIARYYDEGRLICGRCYDAVSGTIVERAAAEAAWGEERAARQAKEAESNTDREKRGAPPPEFVR